MNGVRVNLSTIQYCIDSSNYSKIAFEFLSGQSKEGFSVTCVHSVASSL
jgi:uncharacterized metal-binding protein